MLSPDLDTVLGVDQRDEDCQFSSLAGLVSDKTLRAVEGMGFTEMMEIQHKAIKPLLQGRSDRLYVHVLVIAQHVRLV